MIDQRTDADADLRDVSERIACAIIFAARAPAQRPLSPKGEAARFDECAASWERTLRGLVEARKAHRKPPDDWDGVHSFVRFCIACTAIGHLALAGLYLAGVLPASWGLGPGWNIVISAACALVARSWSFLEAP